MNILLQYHHSNIFKIKIKAATYYHNNFLFIWYFDFDAASGFRLQTCRSDTRTVFAKINLTLDLLCNDTFMVLQCSFKIVNLSQQKCLCICYYKVTVIALIIQFTTATAGSFNLQELTKFSAFISLFYGYNKLNWPWNFKQYSIVP